MITFGSSFGSVQLPNPVLGDSEQHDIKTKFEISMSKQVHSTIMTPTHSTYLLTFVNLIETQYNAFRAWFIGSRGLAYTYTDYKSVVHNGIVRNEPVEISPDARSECAASSGVPANAEVATITIEFEAVN